LLEADHNKDKTKKADQQTGKRKKTKGKDNREKI
jgi:hypothetical protein